MQLRRTLFNPALYYENSEIAPTVKDNYFRMQGIQGYVHDPAAAMMGGVSGNAGLFTNATELGIIFQMLLQGGEYKGIRYLRSSTIHEFTQAGHKKTHRGLGFDKPNGLTGEQANISGMLPLSVFGHTGFTGNWAWADPKNQIVFIFLSNRTYPDENNKKLSENNIRTRAIEIVYKALE
jgi:CubicO group peptidase (beta-lactamase class C family)